MSGRVHPSSSDGRCDGSPRPCGRGEASQGTGSASPWAHSVDSATPQAAAPSVATGRTLPDAP
ncbi:hypothetical protein FEF34_09435 [Streptomyces marianii]|uniref:Uncharacterized protein n=1 Tax=Streptomyces marianii TaxID=1817406 RepID=A0A5R9E313_9ACTN|nr:hypothetical protein FEF34_09435 [Streptomyces marianii]